jgi:hypothetical protein
VINPSSTGLSDVIVLVDDNEEEVGMKRSCSVVVSCSTVPD